MEKSNAGNGSVAESIAVQNNRQLHTHTNMISDVHLKLDELIVQQQQLLTQPSPNSNDDHSVPVEQETEFVFAFIASESALEEFDKSLNLEEQFVQMKEWLSKQITAVQGKRRMHDALYLMFNRVFLIYFIYLFITIQISASEG